MIFVTIGTQLPFDRLIRILDEMAPQLDEEIIAQVHHCGFQPRNIKTFSFIPPDEHKKIFNQARLIVAHAGMGTILSAMQQSKPIIVFPRKASLNEHRNEHQMATAFKLKEQNSVYVALTEQDLKKLLMRKDLHCLRTISDKASESLIKSIEEFIDA